MDDEDPVEEFAVSTVRLWKSDGRLRMRVLNRVGLEPGDEHTSSVATTEIEEAVTVVRDFISDFAAPDKGESSTR